MVCLQPAPVNLLAFAQTSRIHQVGTAISHSVLLLQNSMFAISVSQLVVSVASNGV